MVSDKTKYVLLKLKTSTLRQKSKNMLTVIFDIINFDKRLYWFFAKKKKLNNKVDVKKTQNQCFYIFYEKFLENKMSKIDRQRL